MIDTSGLNSLAPLSAVDDDLGENLFSSVSSFQLPRTTDVSRICICALVILPCFFAENFLGCV